MKVAVGTENQAKLLAVRQVFAKVFPAEKNRSHRLSLQG